MNSIRQQTPEWFPKRFLNNIKDDLDSAGECVITWHITKQSMIATLNYIRGKGYKCEWIEKGNDEFIIKITNNNGRNI